MPKKRRKPSVVATGAPDWMVTYGDMVTLLLCFFILLYSYSVIDEQKYAQIISSLQVSFLGERGIMQSSIDSSNGEIIELSLDFKIQEVIVTYQSVKESLIEEGLDQDVKIRVEERGVVLEIEDRILFDSAKADIKPEAERILVKVAGILKRLPNQIIVEGHTDNVPINTVFFPSNWELSVARAVRVVRFLSEAVNIPSERFIAAGYGEYRPIANNNTAEGRATNRRVNIIISE